MWGGALADRSMPQALTEMRRALRYRTSDYMGGVAKVHERVTVARAGSAGIEATGRRTVTVMPPLPADEPASVTLADGYTFPRLIRGNVANTQGQAAPRWQRFGQRRAPFLYVISCAYSHHTRTHAQAAASSTVAMSLPRTRSRTAKWTTLNITWTRACRPSTVPTSRRAWRRPSVRGGARHMCVQGRSAC